MEGTNLTNTLPTDMSFLKTILVLKRGNRERGEAKTTDRQWQHHIVFGGGQRE
jgi:hypothetical protein